MSLPIRIIDHADRLVGMLPWPLSERSRFIAWMRAVGHQLQELEDVFWALLHARYIDEAVGAQLDQWGGILNEPRGGLHDGEYRSFLKAKLHASRSRCTPDEVCAILRTITGDQAQVHYYSMPPRRYGLAYFTATPLSAEHRARLIVWMQRLQPAGYALDHLVEAPLGAFGLDDDPNTEGWDEGIWGEVIWPL